MATQTLTPPRIEWATGDALPMILRLSPVIEMSEAQFLAFCEINKEVRIERTAGGEIEIMPPAGMYTGAQNSGLTAQVWSWARRDSTGVAFDSSAGFTLSNGAVRSPDASWVLKSRLEELTAEDKRGFGHICPDFVIELRSPTDRLSVLRAKMEEYMENGARLGWLLDSESRRVYVYRPNLEAQILENPETVSAEPELAGFALELEDVWGQPF